MVKEVDSAWWLVRCNVHNISMYARRRLSFNEFSLEIAIMMINRASLICSQQSFMSFPARTEVRCMLAYFYCL